MGVPPVVRARKIVAPAAESGVIVRRAVTNKENTNMAQTLTGGCLCGAVRYKVTGDQIFSGRCYCNDCRKTSGTGHNAVFAVPEQAVSITGKLTDYTKPGGSGQPFTRRFCPVC